MKNLTYKSVDVMKKSKDTLTGQLSTAEKISLVKTLATLGITHIAISVPMDDNSVFTDAGTTPSPKTVEYETMEWCDIIHAQDSVYGEKLKVIHRGTFAAIENIFSVAFDDAATPPGDAASASTDGNDSWCGKYYGYLHNHVGDHVLDGDIFAPIPEGTTHAFDGHMFVDNSGSGTIANYAQLFADLHTITDAYATEKGVLLVFMSHNNFSELTSGWIPESLLTDQGVAGFDYYGQRQGSAAVNPEDYLYDLQQLGQGKDSNGGGANNAGGFPQMWGEWGEFPSAVTTLGESNQTEWEAWLTAFYKTIRDNLVTPNGGATGLIGFNYWGGWEGQNTSLLKKTGSGPKAVYSLNFRGTLLREFFLNDGAFRAPKIMSGSSADTYAY